MKICITCEKPFEEKRIEQINCSRSCNAKYHNKQLGKKFECPKCLVCGNPTRRQSRAKYCSVHCQGVARQGENHPLWKGGIKKRKDGYVYIHKPEHPNNSNGYMLEHRIVMENQLGRILSKEEIVHHVNNIKNDNRIENLMLLKDQAEHLAVHNFLVAFRKVRSPRIKSEELLENPKG